MQRTAFKTVEHAVDFCVIGGGMAGLCAAIAAARHGAKTALVHDRPVLGGNASSESRMHISGADRNNSIPNMRETGILEEIRLENLRHNPNRNYSVWDLELFDICKREPNLELILNCSVNSAEMDGSAIRSVTGWQLTTETWRKVRAKIFADCSGDGVLAPLSGAAFRIGREARSEFNESIAPKAADARTMGMTCMFGAKEHPEEQIYEPPKWARKFVACDEMPYGMEGHLHLEAGYWWIELGGEHDCLHDTERLRDELLKIVMGVWDHIKNHCPNKARARNWALDWVQFLPAKRESRRYEGLHILTQSDIASGGKFTDVVAYGGWAMDDHHPSGFEALKIGAEATIFHHSPSPYGIPYRSLCSANVPNLMFAGRNASCTHAAMSSTRVMGTCSIMGQAAGTAAAMAVKHGLPPRALGEKHIAALQHALMDDDCYLPGFRLEMSPLTMASTLKSSNGVDPEPLRDGVNRPVGDDMHCWTARAGDSVEYVFNSSQRVEQATVVVDSALDAMIALSIHCDKQLTSLPKEMPKRFMFEILRRGRWERLAEANDNSQRLFRIEIGKECEGVRFTLLETWGAPSSKIFLFHLDEALEGFNA